MIGRILSFAIFFVILTGLVIHFDIDIPYFSNWIGHLPGDLILRKGAATIFLPFTTSFILSFGLSLLAGMISGKK
jgi:hypothetical protein